MNELSDQQGRVFEALSATPNEDVPMAALYQCAKGRTDLPLPTNREQQQYLGPFIVRINLKLNGQRIEPGKTKRTYRLNTNAKV